VDVPILLVVLSIVQVVTAIVVGLLYSLHRTVPGPLEWIIGKSLHAGGLLLAFWATSHGAGATLILAHAIQQSGILVLGAGYARFAGRAVPWRLLVALPLGYLAVGLALQGTASAVALQTVAYLTVIGIGAVFSAWVLLWRRPRQAVAQGFAGALWGIVTAVTLANIVQILRAMPTSVESLWADAAPGAVRLVLIWAIIQAILMAGAMVMMVADRLRTQLNDRIRDLDTSRRIAEDAVQEQRNFLAMVSHEFRSPLSMIGASAAVIRHNLPPRDRESAEELERIERVTIRLSNLVEACLADDWLDTAARGPSLVVCPLRACLEPVAAEQKVPLHWEMAGDVLVKADSLLLPVVFSCLIDNANKYGRTRQKTMVVCRQSKATPGWVEIVVRDDGPGLRSEDFALLTQKYRRAAHQMRSTSGLGLGLYLARRIVDLHGGEIDVCGSGDTGIQVTLPVVSPDHVPVSVEHMGQAVRRDGPGLGRDAVAGMEAR
jgi:signal transduction histidine kinase